MDLQPTEKTTFSRVHNLCVSNNTHFIYNNNRIFFNGKCYKREGNDWNFVLVNNKSEFIGFVDYEIYKREITELKDEIEKLNASIANFEEKDNISEEVDETVSGDEEYTDEEKLSNRLKQMEIGIIEIFFGIYF